MKIGARVIDNGRLARIAATNRDSVTSQIWQCEIEYLNQDETIVHPLAIAWVHPSRLIAVNRKGETCPQP